MADTALAPGSEDTFQEERLIKLVMDGVTSPNSRRAYRTGLTHFFQWVKGNETRPAFSKALVQEYKSHLQSLNLSAATINLRLSTLKKLAAEMSDNGQLDGEIAQGISRAKGVKQAGEKAGNWLVPQQANELLRAPDTVTLRGLRDRAILAVLLSCGLRRAELIHLRIEDLVQREGRWVFVDLVGKGMRTRTITVPANVKVAIDRWTSASRITSGALFRPINKGDVISGTEIKDEKVIWNIVARYASMTGLGPLAPHDLRRTCAKLCRKGGGNVEQIKFLLGHSSIQTTERYLGSTLDYQNAVNDGMGLEVE